MSSKMKINPNSLVKWLKLSVYKELKRYNTNEVTYKDKLLKDILYNEKSHLVAIFKDFLIYDDSTEFLKRLEKIFKKKDFIIIKNRIKDFRKFTIFTKQTRKFFRITSF